MKLSQNSSLLEIQIYPNPAKSYFNILLNGITDQVYAVVYNDKGQPVKTDIFQNGINRISTENLRTGLYTIVMNLQNEGVKYCNVLIQ